MDVLSQYHDTRIPRSTGLFKGLKERFKKRSPCVNNTDNCEVSIRSATRSLLIGSYVLKVVNIGILIIQKWRSMHCDGASILVRLIGLKKTAGNDSTRRLFHINVSSKTEKRRGFCKCI